MAAEKPRWMKWRDFGLTLMMWIVFAIMLETEFELFAQRQLVRLGLADFDTDARWGEFFERLRPFLGIALILIGILAVASLATLVRRRRGLLIPPPPPLAMEAQARRAGMDEATLAAARELENVVVYIDQDRTHRVKPPHV
jgi:hypothetical protein